MITGVSLGPLEGSMFRLVVALYLMLVTAAGPATCCCTVMRLATRSAEQPSATAAPQEQPAAPASCCHQCTRGEDPPGSPTNPATPGHHQRPDSPGCPCKQTSGCEIVGLPPASNDEAQQASLRGAALAEWSCPSALLSSQTATV